MLGLARSPPAVRQPRRAATDDHNVTCTFGRARSDTAPARPGRDRLGRLGRGGEALERQGGRQGPAEAQSARMPHLDHRRAADVQTHERAAADLVDDRVRRRQRDALAGGGRGDRGRAAAVGGERGRRRGRGGRGTIRSTSSGRARAGRPASVRPPTPPGRSRAATASGWSGAATRIRRQRRNGADGDPVRRRVRAERDVGVSVLQAPPRTRAVTGLDRDLQAFLAGPEQLDQRRRCAPRRRRVATTRKPKGPDPLSSR